MNVCIVCKKDTSQGILPEMSIPLIGMITSTNGWYSHSDCLFPFTITS